MWHTNLGEMLDEIEKYISEFELDRENKQGYLDLRESYNKCTYKYPMHFYTLICHSFSNQIRFNSKGEFNLPFGKRTFNDKLKERFNEFIRHFQQQYVQFYSLDFRKLDLTQVTNKDFVYIDPPYLITTASYNENGGWTEQDERDLLDLMDKLNSLGIKFALSNVFENKGRKNEMLIDWSKKYNVHYLNHSYSSSNYQSSDKGKNTTVEVLVTNY